MVVFYLWVFVSIHHDNTYAIFTLLHTHANFVLFPRGPRGSSGFNKTVFTSDSSCPCWLGMGDELLSRQNIFSNKLTSKKSQQQDNRSDVKRLPWSLSIPCHASKAVWCWLNHDKQCWNLQWCQQVARSNSVSFVITHGISWTFPFWAVKIMLPLMYVLQHPVTYKVLNNVSTGLDSTSKFLSSIVNAVLRVVIAELLSSTRTIATWRYLYIEFQIILYWWMSSSMKIKLWYGPVMVVLLSRNTAQVI